MKPIECTYGTKIEVVQSSATAPHIWVRMWQYPTSLGKQEPGYASAHLSIQQAKKLRDRLDKMIQRSGKG